MGLGGSRLCRKPLPEDVCFNADSVPVEAVMLICPLVTHRTTSVVDAWWKPIASACREQVGGRTEHRGGPQEANTACFYPFSASPSTLLTYADPSGGGILFSDSDCINPHTASTHMHSHISAAHQILQLDEEYQWEQWASGQTMDSASRPARQPWISWLMWQKNTVRPSGCPKNETFSPKRRAWWKNLGLVSLCG